ncbi:MAG: hypothetical protein CM15mP74_01330 [Halieaceae bacterium]|nr:MAG: hypothetical protein CM15mP74_01330 [Halieaceae bacterium]
MMGGATGSRGAGSSDRAGRHATLAQVRGFSVGGKTGTVHKVGQGGYLDDQYVACSLVLPPWIRLGMSLLC